MNLPHHRRITASQLTPQQWEVLKWFGNVCLILGTIAMISPQVASTAVTPWMLYLLGNGTWLADSIHTRNKPWIYIAIFLMVWDVLTITTRITGVHVFSVFDPFITFLNILP
jgi:hypothetical protein